MSSPNSDLRTAIRFYLLCLAAGAAIILVALCGCANTVAPKFALSSEPSWVGADHNSGVIAITPAHQAILTPHARDRYNGLIAIYGSRFLPPLKPDFGLTEAGPNGIISPEGLADFATMNRWRKAGAIGPH